MKMISPEEIKGIRCDTELPLYTCILDMVSFAESVGANTAQAQLESCEKEHKEKVKEIIQIIESYFLDTIEPDGVIIHHLDDPEWQSVKQRIFRQAETLGGD